MTWSARTATVSTLVLVLALFGCAQPQTPQPEQGQSSVTWEEAKAAAKAKTLEIVASIPSDEVVSGDQHETGSFFSCDETRHAWTGITYVTLVPGADIEAITKEVEEQLADLLRDRGDFEVTNRRDLFDDYAVTAQSTSTAEAYLLGASDPGAIAIDAWSVCFTLPEGTYPGGSF